MKSKAQKLPPASRKSPTAEKSVALIDIGNSYTKYAIALLPAGAAQKADAKKYSGTVRLPALEVKSFPTEDWSDEYLADLKKLASGGALICCVVPEVQTILRKKWKAAQFLTHQNCTLTFDYAKPESIGADRLANAVAARAFCAGPAVVLSAGSAATFEVLDAKGRFIGGAISPGLQAVRDALSHAGAQLPQLPPLHAETPAAAPAPSKKTASRNKKKAVTTDEPEWLGRDTLSSMELGTLIPWQAGLSVLAQQLRALAAATTPKSRTAKAVQSKGTATKKSAALAEELQSSEASDAFFAPLLLTGGDAALLEPLLCQDAEGSSAVRMDHLALQGLYQVATTLF